MPLTICKLCGHGRDSHRGIICGERDCTCFCALEVAIPKSEPPPIDSLPEQWQETVLMQLFDLLFGETEGEISVPTTNGTVCKVRVRFTPEIGYHVVSGGQA